MASNYPMNSRYYSVGTASYTLPDGRTVTYLRRRFLPQPEALALLQEYQVAAGDRPDTVAAQRLGDPELFWRLCDANNSMRPAELTETVGRRLRITLPDGIPGYKPYG